MAVQEQVGQEEYVVLTRHVIGYAGKEFVKIIPIIGYEAQGQGQGHYGSKN